MRFRKTALILLTASVVGWSQLTTDQKISDFEQASGLFVKGYGPADWKKKAFGIDLLDTAPWLEKIRATKTDLEFYEVMSSYFNSLNDAHVSYYLPSNFDARLHFTVDIYDGKLLIDAINRTRLPAAEYPFAIGYELVSIDGEDAGEILEKYLKYSAWANESSTRRFAAILITTRPQQIIPDAPNVPEISTVVLRSYDGGLETYRIPWAKSGLPLTEAGKFPELAAKSKRSTRMEGGKALSSFAKETPEYMRTLESLWNFRLPGDRQLVGYGSIEPVYFGAIPANFEFGVISDDLVSGIFEAEGLRMGFMRIPHFSPEDVTGALTAFAEEIRYMQENTDGLIIDIMRNPGGSGSYTNSLLSLIHFYPWYSVGAEVRVTSRLVADVSSAYEDAKSQDAPQEILDLLLALKNEFIETNRANRALTRPIALDGLELLRDPAKDSKGDTVAYTLPVMVLMDEFSASAADLFAATIQDNGRGILFGHRTMGAGGNVTAWDAGSYSGGYVTMTESLLSRKYERAEAGGYPVSPYVENVGVHPEIENDFMTYENLATGGKPFVDAFIAAMADHIRKNR